MISCANKILSRSNNILSPRNKLKNKTRMSLPGFRTLVIDYCLKHVLRRDVKWGLWATCNRSSVNLGLSVDTKARFYVS